MNKVISVVKKWWMKVVSVSFSYFIGQIINWGVGALFFIWGLNIIMSMLRKIIMIIAGVKGE